MSAPMRLSSGFTQDTVTQPLGGVGFPNPFFYAVCSDDFLPYQPAKYTVTAASGSVAQTTTDGSGGRILFTTGAVATNFAEIQAGAFGGNPVAGKKAVFFTRLRLADVTNSAIIAGAISSNVTPFTAVTDGIYFSKAAGSTTLQLIVVAGGVTIGSASIAGQLTAGQDFDLAFYLTPKSEVLGFVGQNLVGPYSSSGPALAIRSLSGALPTASLGATLAVQTSTAVAQTMVSDFLLCAMER